MSWIKTSRANLNASCYNTEENNNFHLTPHFRERKYSQGEKEQRRKGKGKHTGMRGFGPHFAQTGCVLHQIPGQMQPLEITGITQGILTVLDP